MIRTGIYNIKQLDHDSIKDLFGKEKNISIYLYQQLIQVGGMGENGKNAEIVLNRFNSNRNIIKRTYKNRFDIFDKLSVKTISEQNFEKISVLDIAISDGRASCYFLEQAIRHLQNFRYTGSDIQINYYLKKRNKNDKSYIITDENNKIIEITYPPYVWNLARTEGSFYFINNSLKKFLLKQSLVALRNNKFKYQEIIELIHPDFRNLLAKTPCFHLQNYNVVDNIPGKFDVIRAMNILHLGYFTKDKLAIVLNNLYNGLELNGLLIEGSNENSGTPVEGAIYKKKGNGFLLLCEPEKPSRIQDLILSFRSID
jgi:hypothetical protein